MPQREPQFIQTADGSAMKAGIDIGGTKIDAVAVTADGDVSARIRVPSGFGAQEVLANAIEALRRLAAQTGEPFSSVGVGIPGVVDTAKGLVRHAVNLGVDEFSFGPALEESLGARVMLANDVDAAALGAYQLLHPDGDIAYLNIGTGLAAGFVFDGHRWAGARGVPGEIGHIPVEPDGVLCACGQRGCLETIASGSAVARLWPTVTGHPARGLFRAADAGNPDARRVRDRLAAGIASAIRIIILTCDVETVVVGGGLSKMGAPLLTDVIQVLNVWASQSPFLASLRLGTRVRLVPADLPVAAVGAAALSEAISPATQQRPRRSEAPTSTPMPR